MLQMRLSAVANAPAINLRDGVIVNQIVTIAGRSLQHVAGAGYFWSRGAPGPVEFSLADISVAELINPPRASRRANVGNPAGSGLQRVHRAALPSSAGSLNPWR